MLVLTLVHSVEVLFFVMIRRPPRSTRTDTRCPYTPLFRSARISGTGFSGEATQLLERALALDPREPFTLMVAGTAAFERGDYQSTTTYWQQLLDQLPAGTEAAQAVANGIERAQRESAGIMVQ